ncbi:solute carrier organic anion transporter family member 2A1-like [Clavelina lepadiformis]|uniref:solute carrier organic anion transporter family member 2A1-like n=1 Tax=Clavelina lepadiformis TaxID=159417 RepID=UPI004042E1F3
MMSTIRNVCERNGSVASAQFCGETSHTSKDSICKRNLPKSTSNVIKLEKGKLKIFSIRAFVGLAGLVMCAQSALAIYSKSVLTSIEKRFEISSSLAGFIVGSFNIGNLLFVVLVSKFSSRGDRPRIMAIGSLLIALGGFVNFTPHLVNQPYQPLSKNESQIANCEENVISNSHNVSSGNSNLYIVLILGEILQGIGATVHIPLSSSYIDDYASKENSPLYLGISFVLQNIGPGFGYLIGSWTSSFYVDFDRVPKEKIPITSDDKDTWIGAWWLGYIIISAWVVVAALPLFFFPKAMTTKRNSAVDTNIEPEAEGNALINIDSNAHECANSHDNEIINRGINSSTVRNTSDEGTEFADVDSNNDIGFCADFWLTVKRLLTNPIYMTIVFAYSGLMFVVGALTAFMPKFIEVVYRKSSGSANLTFGLAVPPTMCLGLLSGGIIVKRFMWARPGIIKFVLVSGATSLIPIFCAYFITCTGNNQDCLNATDSVTSRPCETEDCDVSAILFVLLMSLGGLIAAKMVTPIYTVVLRSVNPQDKCTAIGVMFLIIRVLGLVPAPIISGAIIDDTCVMWNKDCGQSKNCIKYDIDQFRFNYLTLIVLGIIACLFFTCLSYLLVRRKEKHANPDPVTKAVTLCLRRYIKTSRDVNTDGEQRERATNV